MRKVIRIIAMVIFLVGGINFNGLAEEKLSTFWGVVSDDATGKPLPDVKVTILEIDKFTTTDKNGEYILPLPQGFYKVSFKLEDYQQETRELKIKAARQNINVSLLSFKTVCGIVIDSVTKEPLEGATVELKEDSLSAMSEKDGSFSFVTERKSVTLSVQSGGYKLCKKSLSFPYQKVTLELELSSEYTLEKVYVKDKFRIEGSKQKIKSEQIKKATTHLFSDSLKIVQTLPGVVTGDDFASLMYIRGGEFYETVSFLDDIYIMMPYIWGGMLSIFNPSFVDTINFYSGGFPVKYPQALSGVIDVKNIEGNYQKHSGFIDLSPATFELFGEGPISKDKFSYVIGARRTYYDLIMSLLYGDEYEDIVFPFFYDAQAKLTWKLNDKDKIWMNLITSYEGMDFDSTSIEESTDSSRGQFKFKYGDVRVLPAINWERVENDHLSFNFTLSNRYGEQYNTYSSTEASFKANTRSYEVFFKNRIIYLTGIHTIEQGLYYFDSWVDVSTKLNYRTLMPDGTYSYEKKTSTFNWTRFAAGGVYLQDDIALVSDRLFLNIGGLFERFDYTNDNNFSPRGGLKYSLTENTTLKFNTGLYTQIPIFFGDNPYGSPPFADNKKIKSEKAIHYIFGVEQELPNHFFFRLETYLKEYYDRIVSDPNPNLYYTNNGKRKSSGYDVFLQRKIAKKWDGWLTYTYLDSDDKISKRSNPDDFAGKSSLDYPEPVGKWYVSSKERKHNISLVMNYDFTQKWKLASTYRFATGMPYTPITGATKYDADVYVPIYGKFRSGRMPNYQRLDVKLTMPFFGVRNMESYVQIINLLGNKNVYGFYYSDDYSKEYEEKMLPFMPIGGVKYHF